MQIVIVGGGSAGWITANYLRQMLHIGEISVIESSKIGILGAGEGVTPHFIGMFLDKIGVPLSALIKHASATLKIGIRFTNWNGDGDFYFHPFEDTLTPRPDLRLLDSRTGILDLRTCNYSAMLAEHNKVPFQPKTPFNRDLNLDPIHYFNQQGACALHFDASRLANFLREVAINRGVRQIDGEVLSFEEDEGGNIKKLHLSTNEVLPADIVFDCSGLHRLIIGKHFDVPWIDVKKQLPVDRAMPFFLPIQGTFPPYTEAIAMSGGWMWKIPTQERYGCGYVFDSEFCTDDDARLELHKVWGENIQLERVIQFQAGYFERIWEKNVVAIGLAGGFLEPLEATAIWAIILTLHEFVRVHLAVDDEESRAAFNRYHRELNAKIVDFLYFHYLGKRSDSEFWRTFRERTQMPERVRTILSKNGMRWNFNEPDCLAGHPAPFNGASYAYVAAGLNLFDMVNVHQYLKFYGLDHDVEARLTAKQQELSQLVEDAVRHNDFLEYLKQ